MPKKKKKNRKKEMPGLHNTEILISRSKMRPEGLFFPQSPKVYSPMHHGLKHWYNLIYCLNSGT